MRKLVRKVEVSGLKPIIGADKIELALIGGWQCVVKKGEFKPGDRGMYFEIDSALPADDERYAFLKDRFEKTWKTRKGDILGSCIRIRTVKMRGEISQGLLLPLDMFPETAGIAEGEDCSEVLGVKLYDELDWKYQPRFNQSQARGNFPAFIPKTDEERIQNLPDWWEKYADVEWEVTRKVDGSSMTVFYAPILRSENPVGLCSRNLELKTDETENVSAFVQAFRDFDLDRKIRAISVILGDHEVAMQGELHGIAMNGNRDNLSELRYAVFKMWDITEQKYVEPKTVRELCRQVGLEHVPVLESRFKAFRELPDMESMLKFAEGKTENGNEREGVVFKRADGNGSESFKVISNRYLLKERE